MSLKRLGYLALMAIVPLMGQASSGSLSHRTQWDGSNLIFLGTGKSPIRVQSPNGFGGSTETIISPPKNTVHVDYKDGTFLATSKTRVAGTGLVKFTFQVRDGAGWRVLGAWQFKPSFFNGGQFQAFLLENDRILVFSDWADFQTSETDHPEPLAILKLHGDATYQLDKTFDFGLKRPYLRAATPQDSGHGAPWILNYPSIWVMESFRVPGFIVLYSTQSGMFFVLSEKNGAVKRSIQLYSIPDERLAASDLMPASLGVSPKQDGTLLVAARSEDAFLNGAARLRSRMKAAFGPEDFVKYKSWNEESVDVSYSEDSRVFWYVVDPESGIVRPEDAPRNFPDKVRSSAEFNSFHWRFNLNGNLEIVAGPMEEDEAYQQRRRDSEAAADAARKAVIASNQKKKAPKS